MSQIIASIIGSIGFSIVFGIRRAYMLPIAVNAGLSWAVYLLVNGFAGDLLYSLCYRDIETDHTILQLLLEE